MCCEICPRYTACEEEGHLDDSCCVSCSERLSCRDEDPVGGSERTEESEEELKTIIEGVKKMSEMIELFLNVSRIEMKTFLISVQNTFHMHL